MEVPELQFLQAPEVNLKTWSVLTKLLFISAAGAAMVLLLLFWAFV